MNKFKYGVWDGKQVGEWTASGESTLENEVEKVGKNGFFTGNKNNSGAETVIRQASSRKWYSPSSILWIEQVD